MVEAEAGDDVEVEPCGVDANGGCNGTLPFQFENISAGVTFSGTSYSGVVDPADPDGGEIRDTDWMLYDHPGGAIIYTSIADFPFQGLVVNNVDDCIDAGVIYATAVNAAGCIAQTDVSGFIPAGTYAIWAGVALNDDGSQRLLECGSGNYRITITSDTTVTDPCDGIVNDGCTVVPDFIYPVNAADPVTGRWCCLCWWRNYHREHLRQSLLGHRHHAWHRTFPELCFFCHLQTPAPVFLPPFRFGWTAMVVLRLHLVLT